MDNSKITVNPNPREKANIISILTWAWTFGIFRRGFSKILGIEDLHDPVTTGESSELGNRLEKQWFAELERARRKNRYPSLSWAICRTFARQTFILGLIRVLNELVIRLATPLLLGALLHYFKPMPETTYEMALYYAGGMTLANFINVFSQSQDIFGGFYLGGYIRIAISSIIYRKALRLSQTALAETAPGKIVNLIANDVYRFDLISTLAHFLWVAPLSAIVIVVLLYLNVGWPALVGVLVIFLVVPFQGYMGELSSRFRLQTALKTDERVRLMDEVISGVQVIKMYAWEKPFCSMVELVRRLELKIVRKSLYLRGIYMTLYLFSGRMALYATLMAMMLSGRKLGTDHVFVCMSYYSVMSLTMGMYFVRAIAEFAEAKVAIERLQNFLMYDEFVIGDAVDENAKSKTENSHERVRQSPVLQASDLLENSAKNEQSVDVNYENSSNEDWAIKLDHVTAVWDPSSSDTTLNDVIVEVPKGKLCIVIGAVGAGKSSFFASILGELKLTEGSKMVRGRISYADQDAWVFGASVRQNIIFGQEFDRQRYQEVIKVCALEMDFRQFPDGDLTIVGERGRSLSGGQKARINLARAVYREADVYLLDDPLSAVDVHVGKHLFEDCIKRHLTGKTRILATHQLQYVKDADAILLFDQGKVLKVNDYHELLNAYPNYDSIIAEEKTTTSNELSTEKVNVRCTGFSSSTKSQLIESATEFNGVNDGQENEVKENKSFKETSHGAVKGNPLVSYIRSGTSDLFVLLMLFLFVATQFNVSLYDYFITILINAENSHYQRNKVHELQSNFFHNDSGILSADSLIYEKDTPPRSTYIYIFTGLIASILVVAIIRSLAYNTMCLRASQRLHDNAFGALIRATMRFFETNASGRILNRFSKDLGGIDELLPKVLLDVSQTYLMLFGSLVITTVVNYLLLIPIALIAVLLYIVQKIYLRTSMDIKRLEATARSPVFTHLNTTLDGITTIRAYQTEKILSNEFDKLQNTHTSAWHTFVSVTGAYTFFLDFLCFIFIALVTFSFLLLKDTVSGEVVGLVLTQTTSMMFLLQWSMRQNAEIRNQLTAVERVLEYSQIPSEPNIRDESIFTNNKKKKMTKKEELGKIQLIEPPRNWPAEGRIQLKNVSMRYSDKDPLVLKDLNLLIQPREKVGIVGRTGAGKSSLISALFRLAKVEGVIEIDGLDTGSIALEDLRKHISIIPQNPVLFSGTLRRNLDPFNKFTDEHLWKVLEEVELKDFVNLPDNGLDHKVHDRGSNYSTGQRQLICLARAILRNNQILVLDEATANVDPHTDALIQLTIRTKFASCTVLTVAHRLNTIIDCDKVLVMDSGEAVEFNHPYLLLQNENDPFSSLVKETGSAMFDQLYKAAHDSYVDKYNCTKL